MTTLTFPFQNTNQTPAQILAANPLGQIVRPPSRGADQMDSGLLSLVEQQQQQQQQPYKNNNARYNQGMVGIDDNNENSSPSDIRNDRIRLDALNDLIVNLSSGSDKSSNSPNTPSAWQVLTLLFLNSQDMLLHAYIFTNKLRMKKNSFGCSFVWLLFMFLVKAYIQGVLNCAVS